MRARFRARPRRMMAIARPLSMSIGMGKGLTSVMGERTKPGQITETPMPSPRRLPLSASPQAFTAALLAQ